MILSENRNSSPVPSDELWKLIKQEGSYVSFRQDEYLYLQNEPSPGVFFLESGKVKIFRIMDNGIESILRIASGKTIIGEISGFNGEDSSPAAIAISPVTAYKIPIARSRELIRENGDFALFMVDTLIYKIKGQSDQLGNVSGKKVENRLAMMLCTLDYYGIPSDKDGWFIISHAELAGLTGATRPHITAILNRFKEKQLIELKRNRIRILKKKELIDTAEAFL